MEHPPSPLHKGEEWVFLSAREEWVSLSAREEWVFSLRKEELRLCGAITNGRQIKKLLTF